MHRANLRHFNEAPQRRKCHDLEYKNGSNTKAITHIIMKIGKLFFHMVPVFGEAKKISTVSFHLSSRDGRCARNPAGRTFWPSLGTFLKSINIMDINAHMDMKI